MSHRPVAPERAELERRGTLWVGRFSAMACPCEVLVDTADAGLARERVAAAAAEAGRIERKFSRYRDDSIVAEIHAARGRPVRVDSETAALLDYAATCHDVSHGAFDITTGVLRRAWTFDGEDRVPDDAAIEAARARVGWARVTWRDGELTLPSGMEIDFGGIGKEYAVDRAAALADTIGGRDGPAVLVNFGGDLAATAARREGAWEIGLEDPEHPGGAPVVRIELESRGGLATSGDARRFVRAGGRRLGHILDPRTGRPVEGAPRSVTVLAASCLEAGTLTTLACLKGARAAAFLAEQGVRHWIL